MAALRPERKSFSSSRLPDLRSPHASLASSVLSNVLPALRRTEPTPDETPALHKSVLVTLKFSSLSFLDSEVKDDASRDPLYVIRTTGTSTRVMRNDPWDGLTKTAEIKWPKVIPTKGKVKETLGVLVQMNDGRWQSGDTVLKPGTMLSAPPRFNIPNFPHSMKWKRVGSAYWCTTSSVKGPVATFHPAVEGVPPRIKVYETLHDKHDSRPILVQNGVSVLLIDHLIITAMLLVTDVQDWMLVQNLPPASASQWRKILYGEPIFPKRHPNSRSASTTDLTAPIPTSSKQMAKILYGDPIYPSLGSSPVTSNWESDDDDDEDVEDDEGEYRTQRDSANSSANSSLPSPPMPATPRVESPSSESIFYPSGQPPSHGHIDPSYYGEDVPPVPQIPAQYASSVSSMSRGATPPDSARLRTRRELPLPPTTPVSESSPSRPAHRSQSTPPREVPTGSFGRRPSAPLFLAATSSSPSASTSSSTSSPRPAPPSVPPIRTLTRSQSMKFRPQRQLPTPPTPTEATSPSDLSRSNTRSSRRSSQYSQRSLPVPPGAAATPPPPLPRPPLRKDPIGDWGGYSWTTNGAGPLSEAPPPYMEADSPTSAPPLQTEDPRRRSTYHS
ncbi:hypothetical protein MSAN_00057900 [Mycena sanguinolenta]|uniref:Uncharacterized protein n=1 Tax=Mycena sanguinolenta TaxID=230812 RepID=A0A8H6ZF99_9AGAR|nr:hypothetical protein MSAN_00057900 [Mycena sanguinolenta]